MGLREADDDAEYVEGGSDARAKILAFLEKLSRSTEVEGEVMLHLCQHGGAQEEVIYEVEFEPTSGPGEIADELVERAEEDCRGLSAKKIKYTVKAEGLAGRATFTLKCSQAEEEDLEDIEDLPNRKGLMRQLMRHQETIMKIATTSQRNVMEMANNIVAEKRREVEDRNKRMESLEAQFMNNAKAYEDLINGRHMRDLELRKLENSERRKDQVGSMLMQGVPILVSKFMGGGAAAGGTVPHNGNGEGGGGAPVGGPMGRTPLEHMMEGFMGTLDQEQFNAIMNSGVFKPEQIMGLMEIFKYILERKAAEEAANAGKKPEGAPAASAASAAGP
jgi:hypothetical protein